MKVSTIRATNWKSFEDTGVVELADINVIVGHNNGGKSAFLSAAHLIQNGTPLLGTELRIGKQNGEIVYELVGDNLLDDVTRYFGTTLQDGDKAVYTTPFTRSGRDSMSVAQAQLSVGSWGPGGVNAISPMEPNNFIYNYLSKRKVARFDETVNRSSTLSVEADLRYLVSKVARLANPDHPNAGEYEELCKKVLGFRVSEHASERGQQAGIPVGSFDYIPIEAMGEGVSSLLGLITDLCVAHGNLFLIEEPENDIHPESLKVLLATIIEKSKENQFIISTHSNIVVRHLVAAENSKLFVIEGDYLPNSVPTSTINEVDPTPEARIEILRKLGYELYDFDVTEGWLILEESSAEAIIVRYLIPWFAPRLARIRTVSAGGVTKVAPTFEDFRRLFLFAHLERSQYMGRAWVVVDGDDPGREAVNKLQADYSTWPAEQFRTWSKSNFEEFYPARFATAAAEALAKRGQVKRDAKKDLLDEVKKWADENPDDAKSEFEASASEVVDFLREIDQALFGG